MRTLKPRLEAIHEAWPAVAALLAGVLALVVQLDASPAALAADAVPAAVASELRLGRGLVSAFERWPSHGVGPLHPVLLALLGHLWPAFPDGLTLVVVVDAALIAWAAGMLASRTQRKLVGAVGAVASLALVVPLVALVHVARAGPIPLATVLVLVAVRALLDERSSPLAIGAMLAAIALTWPGAVLMPLVVGAACWERRRRVAVIAMLGGLGTPVAWWLVSGGAGAPWSTYGLDQVFDPWTVIALGAGTAALWSVAPLLRHTATIGLVVLGLVVGGALLGRAVEAVVLALPVLGLSLVPASSPTPHRAVWGLVVAASLTASITLLSMRPLDRETAVRLDMLEQGIVLGLDDTPHLASDQSAQLAVRLRVPVHRLETACVVPTTHVALATPAADSAWRLAPAMRGASLDTLFRLVDGPALMAVQCPD